MTCNIDMMMYEYNSCDNDYGQQVSSYCHCYGTWCTSARPLHLISCKTLSHRPVIPIGKCTFVRWHVKRKLESCTQTPSHIECNFCLNVNATSAFLNLLLSNFYRLSAEMKLLSFYRYKGKVEHIGHLIVGLFLFMFAKILWNEQNKRKKKQQSIENQPLETINCRKVFGGKVKSFSGSLAVLNMS